MQSSVSAGYLGLLCEVATREYGLDAGRLGALHGCSEAALDEPDALVPHASFLATLRHVLAETGDRGLGLRLAHALDLRAQGFWGYALLSANSVRERIDVHLRYQRLRGLSSLTTSVQDGMLVAECTTDGLPPDLAPVMLDFGFAAACIQHKRRLARPDSQLHLWLTSREEPHHRALRALVAGPVVFEAPCNRLKMPIADLELALAGDPSLGKLMTAQLDARLASLAPPTADLIEHVRACVQRRLARDLSLEAVCAELAVSPRTLRRQLGARGTTYQALVEQERLARAAAYLRDTDAEVAWISGQLGYGDPSNFRRAFKRWTGQAPSEFRGAAAGPEAAGAR